MDAEELEDLRRVVDRLDPNDVTPVRAHVLKALLAAADEEGVLIEALYRQRGILAAKVIVEDVVYDTGDGKVHSVPYLWEWRFSDVPRQIVEYATSDGVVHREAVRPAPPSDEDTP